MMFEKRQQTAICIIAAMLIADFIMFGYLPSYKIIKELRQQRMEQKSVISQGRAQDRQLSPLTDKLSEVEKRVSKYGANLPEERQLGEFLHNVADLMDRQNLKEQRIEPGEEVKTEKLNCIPVKMSCRGTLKEIFQFYRQLQLLDRIVRIQQVRLLNDKDFNGQVNMQTDVVIYYACAAGT